jgi:hypothetical protein
MKHIDYWKLKSQAAAAESAVDTYPSGHFITAGWLINRSRNPWGFPSPTFAVIEIDLAKSQPPEHTATAL